MEEPETENVKLSPYNRFKHKLDEKMDKMTDKLRKEVNEELQDNEKHVNDAQVRYRYIIWRIMYCMSKK